MLQVAGKSINFLVDMGATYSVLPSFRGTLRPSQVSFMGIDGQPSRLLQTQPLSCQLDSCLFTHSFLVIPSCPTPLFGRDILAKLKATLHLTPESAPMSGAFLMLLVDPPTSSVNPEVWDTRVPVVAPPSSPRPAKGPHLFPSPAPVSFVYS